MEQQHFHTISLKMRPMIQPIYVSAEYLADAVVVEEMTAIFMERLLQEMSLPAHLVGDGLLADECIIVEGSR